MRQLSFDEIIFSSNAKDVAQDSSEFGNFTKLSIFLVVSLLAINNANTFVNTAWCEQTIIRQALANFSIKEIHLLHYYNGYLMAI